MTLTEDETATLASRLAKLELDLSVEERRELDGVAGQPVRDIIRGLVAALDPDAQLKAQAEDSADVQALLDEALDPIASNPELRTRIIELRAKHDQIIDEVSVDRLLDARGQVDRGKARSVVDSWKQYIDDHQDEITALQLMYTGGGSGRTSYAELRELADRIRRPPHNWTPDLLWKAYEVLDVDRVTHASRHTVTDLVSLVRFTLGDDQRLVPYASKVEERYAAWLVQQEQAGAVFTDRQRWWLDRMADVIATSAGITADDLDNAPFAERGGVDGALRDLGDAEAYLDQLNDKLPA